MQAFLNDGQGGKHFGSFYGVFPKLEMGEMVFVVEAYSQRATPFTASDLAHFIDTRLCELTQIIKTNN